MRKLLSIAVLAAALPNMAFAEGETSPAADLQATINACADASCKEDAIKAALDAGMDINAVVAAAKQAGVSADSIATAAVAGGVTGNALSDALVSNGVATQETVGAVMTTAAVNNNLSPQAVLGATATGPVAPQQPVVPTPPEPNPNNTQS
jgi:hypothetical protein